MSQLLPSATTVSDLCTAALKDAGVLGVGQTPLAEDITDAWARLQWMLQQWERKRWLVYHLVTYGIVSTGAQSYTIGPDGQINTNVLAAYGIDNLVLLSGGNGYFVGQILTLTGVPPLANGSTPPQVTVTAINSGGVILTDNPGLLILTENDGTILTENLGGATGIIVSFEITNPGQLAAPLPVSFSEIMTGGGATFQFPTYFTLTNTIRTASGSVRPAKIESAFLRQLTQSQPNQIDYPLEILQSREDYNKIALKQLMSFPGVLFYDSSWPLGQVYAWPVPQANIYSINVSILEQLPTNFSTAATQFQLPFEYYGAIVPNLALRLRPKYQIPTYPGDPLPGIAKDALNVLRGANVQIARLSIPPDMNRPGIYNIFSDRFY